MTGRHRPIRGEWGDPLLRAEDAENCLRLLCEARDCAQGAGAHRTYERIKLAISSAKGARRHADGRAAEWRRTHQTQEPERS